MTLDHQRLGSLLQQLNMAYAKKPISAMQVAILKAQIRELRAKIEGEKNDHIH